MERDYLEEAWRIDAAATMMLPERAHIVALCWEIRSRDEKAEQLRRDLAEAQHQLEILKAEVLNAVHTE